MTTTEPTTVTARETVEQYLANGGDVEQLTTAAIEVDPEAANLAVLSILGEHVDRDAALIRFMDDVLAVLPDAYVSGVILDERYYCAAEVPDWLDVDKVVPSDVQDRVTHAYRVLRRELLRERSGQPGHVFDGIVFASGALRSFEAAIGAADLPDGVYEIIVVATGAKALQELVASVANVAAAALGEREVWNTGPMDGVHHLDVGYSADPVSID